MHLAYIDGRIESYRSIFVSNIEKRLSQLSLISDFCGEEIQCNNKFQLQEIELKFGSKSIVCFSRIISILRKIKPDVVISGDMGIRTFLSVLYCNFNNIPVYPWARLTTWSERRVGLVRKILRKLIISLSTGVIVNSQDGAAYLRSLKKCNTYILYQSSSHSVLANSPRKIENSVQSRWVFVGKLNEAKGLKAFFEAVANIDLKLRSNLIFDLIGDGNLKEWLQGFLEKNEIQHKFHGNLNGNEVIEALDNATFFFFPTLCDEWGLAVVEAMNRGLPILGSLKSGSIVELSAQGEFGLLFDPRDTDQLRFIIKSALQMNSAEYAHLALGSWQIAKSMELQPEKMAEKFFEIINREIDSNT